MNRTQLYNEIYETKDRLASLYSEYWSNFAGPETWYFWFNLASVVLPLVLLFFVIDRERIFEISFFGYSAHMLWLNTDTILSAQNFLTHPHGISHLFPIGITVTAVLFPVTFMLLYQHCTNKGKNFYLYAVIVSAIFAYVLGGLSDLLDLLRMHKGMNLTYLFLIDVAVVFVALWATRLFLRIKRTKRRI
ncbi:hypothetical protein [Lentibacillus sediminis]|uniref:hypothetical protein n=1 Tax=Lentibacillus sediminis TaxID=1940529 RepID=UPI000C1BF6EF|nr:hypothetical protein [Lentibacillus sediminis]